MARRKPNLSDNLIGMLNSLRSGTAMNPFATMGHIHRAHDARIARDLGNYAISGATDTAVGKWLEKVNRGPRTVQFTSSDAKVKVASGYDRRRRVVTTDIIVADRNNRTEHLHVIIDEDGNILKEEWNPNHS